MKLWILKAREDLIEGNNPWEPWYDKYFGFVIRAENEAAARNMADTIGGDENRGGFLDKRISKTVHPWLDMTYSICTELSAKGKASVILSDFHAA